MEQFCSSDVDTLWELRLRMNNPFTQKRVFGQVRIFCLSLLLTQLMGASSMVFHTIGCKLVKLSGVLNRLKRYLPEYVFRTLYCSMVQPRLTYGILAWGLYHYRLEKIQNRIIRIISRSKYNAPTRPIFKTLELLTLHDFFSLNCLRFL